MILDLWTALGTALNFCCFFSWFLGFILGPSGVPFWMYFWAQILLDFSMHFACHFWRSFGLRAGTNFGLFLRRIFRREKVKPKTWLTQNFGVSSGSNLPMHWGFRLDQLYLSVYLSIYLSIDIPVVALIYCSFYVSQITFCNVSERRLFSTARKIRHDVSM